MSQESTGLRAFIAILPDKVFLEAANLQLDYLNKEPAWQQLIWHNLTNLHITLHHLGQIRLDELNILQEIKSVCSNSLPFSIEFDSLCYFPEKHPKVVAVKVKNNANLQTLALNLQTKLNSTKIQFQAHLTLGRLPAGFNDFPTLPNLGPLPSFIAKACYLLESRRQGKNSLYIPLAKFVFMP